MNVNLLPDEELADKLEEIYMDNQQFPHTPFVVMAQFVRECTKDSLPTEKEIEKVINDWLSCGKSYWTPDDVKKIAHALRVAMEGSND